MDEIYQKTNPIEDYAIFDPKKNSEPIHEKALNWWKNLQKVLDEAGCALDLTKPETTIRLVRLSISRGEDPEIAGPDKSVLKVTPSYALDPEARPIDLENITPKEMLSRQQVNPTDEVIDRLYQEARAGLLIVRTPENDKVAYGPRQILVGDDGETPQIGNDINNLTPTEKIIVNGWKRPQYPIEPDAEVKAKAEAGDPFSQRQLDYYQEDLASFQELYEQWKPMQELQKKDPGFYYRNQAMSILSEEYLNSSQQGDELMGYLQKVNQIQSDFERQSLSKEELAFRDYKKNVGDQLADARRELTDMQARGELSLDAPLPRKAQDLLAKFSVVGSEWTKVSAENADPTKFPVKTDAQLQAEIVGLRQSVRFRESASVLTGKNMDELLGEDSEHIGRAVDKLIQKKNDKPAPTMEETREKFRDLYQRLKNDDSIFNWRNSGQYRDLLTALDRAVKTLNGASGPLSGEKASEVEKALTNVENCAQAYQAHIGLKGKNARQQRRLDMTEELLTFTERLVDPNDASRWKQTVKAANEREPAEAHPSKADVSDGRKLDAGPEKTGELTEAERTLHQVRRRTDSLRERIQAQENAIAAAPENATEQAQFNLNRDKEILQAREQLSVMAGREGLDKAEVVPLVASVVMGNEAKMLYPTVREGNYPAWKSARANRPEFTNLVEKYTSADLNQFLAGPAEHQLMNEYRSALASSAAPEPRKSGPVQPQLGQQNPQLNTSPKTTQKKFDPLAK